MSSEMFFCKLKFVIDLLKKWLEDKYFKRFKEIDYFKKQNFERENPINRDKTMWFRLLTGVLDFPGSRTTTYLDFIVRKKHAFIGNIFVQNELKQSIPISTIEKFHESFRKVLQVISLLQTNYSSESDLEDISDDCIAEFVEDKSFESFSELFLKIENTKVKNTGWENRREVKLVKIIAFVYFQVMGFPPNRLEIKRFVTISFFTSLCLVATSFITLTSWAK